MEWKMASKFIFLVLPALAVANINIELSGTFQKDMHVSFSGEDIDIISDKEIGSFQLSDYNLKRGINAYFGKTPDDIYIKSPTPWGDLYKSYGWKEVTRTLVPKSGRIISMTDQPEIVVQQIFENNSTKSGSFNVAISQTVQNTMSSSWSKSGDLTIGEEINCEVEMDFLKMGAKTTLQFSSAWGRSSEKSQSVTIGSSAQMEMVLEPGQAVLAELQATRGSMKVEIEYEASLSGLLAVNYDSNYKGHHFWSLDVGAVMSGASLSNKLTSKQTMEIGFFSNSKVVVYDRKLKTKLMDAAF